MTEALKEETNGYMIDIELPEEVRDSIRKAQFAAKPLNAVDFSALPHSDDTVNFTLSQAHEPEEFDEEEEILPVIDVAGRREVSLPSSPPGLPDYESPPSTPCPYQYHTHFQESLRDLVREGRVTAEGSLAGQGNTYTASFAEGSVSPSTAHNEPEPSLPSP
ncbi:unnamed protein product [Fusarium graminearum]|nr:unnamed protein product [Fusarium graminearum]